MRLSPPPWRPLVALISALASTGVCADSASAAYPSRPVTLVVPTAAAGGTDAIARLLAQALSQSIQQPFVVENRPGANGILGLHVIAKAPADGYRLLFAYASAVVINPSLYPQLPYDTLRDLAPIAQVGRGGNVLLVNKDLPVNTLQELVDYAKARPHALNYCSWGQGSGGHLTMERLQQQAGIHMAHVPYQGAHPCIQSILAGQVDAGFADVSTTAALVQSGRAKALAHSSHTRLPLLPKVPSMTEAGYPFQQYSWYGLFAPAKTPPAIVQQLNTAVLRVLQEPAMVQRLHDLNLTDLPLLTPQQFAQTVRADMQAWGKIVQETQVQLDGAPPLPKK